MRILVVEDNRDIAANLGDYLEERGHTVDYAADGITGLHLAVVHAFDAIVLDLNLPGMDGLEVCRKLRQKAFKLCGGLGSWDGRLCGFLHCHLLYGRCDTVGLLLRCNGCLQIGDGHARKKIGRYRRLANAVDTRIAAGNGRKHLCCGVVGGGARAQQALCQCGVQRNQLRHQCRAVLRALLIGHVCQRGFSAVFIADLRKQSR